MKINTCRICGNKNLVLIGSLGNIAMSNFTAVPQNGTKYPLELVFCRVGVFPMVVDSGQARMTGLGGGFFGYDK